MRSRYRSIESSCCCKRGWSAWRSAWASFSSRFPQTGCAAARWRRWLGGRCAVVCWWVDLGGGDAAKESPCDLRAALLVLRVLLSGGRVESELAVQPRACDHE